SARLRRRRRPARRLPAAPSELRSPSPSLTAYAPSAPFQTGPNLSAPFERRLELGVGEHVPLERGVERPPAPPRLELERGVERVETEDVAVGAALRRRTRSPVAGVAVVVAPLDGRPCALGKAAARGIHAPRAPVRGGSDRRVEILDEERERDGLLRDARPLERRRDVVARARETLGNRVAGAEGGARQAQARQADPRAWRRRACPRACRSPPCSRPRPFADPPWDRKRSVTPARGACRLGLAFAGPPRPRCRCSRRTCAAGART